MPADDYRHLVPVVDALIAAGNMTVRGGFTPSQGGWDCLMRDPLDLAILRPLVAADPHAHKMTFASTGLDCLHCWSGIYPIAAEPGVEERRVDADLHAAGWADHTSISRELRTWSRLAHEVNRYDVTVDDYTNDVCSRDYLAAALDRCSPQLRERLQGLTASIDAVFRENTVDDANARLTRFYRVDEGAGWWWRRRPADGPLANYLRGAE